MKSMAITFCLMVVLCTGVGCAAKNPEQESSREPPIVNTSGKLPGGNVPFEQVNEEQWPADIREWVHANAQQPGEYSKHFGDKTYLLVAAGERGSGGFRIIFEKVEAKDGKLSVTATIHRPEGPAIQVITYPVGVARIGHADGLAVSFVVTERGGR